VAFCSTFWHPAPLCPTQIKNATAQIHTPQGFDAFFDNENSLFCERLFEGFFRPKKKKFGKFAEAIFPNIGEQMFCVKYYNFISKKKRKF